MTAHAPPAPGAPWYRQFWPWFIVGLLGISVVGSLSTVFIAVSGADPEVRRDHVAASKAAIAQAALPRDRALALGVGAMLGIEADGVGLRLEGWTSDGALPDRVAVHFLHPTLAERDVRVVAVREADGAHRALLPSPLEGRYEIAISPAGESIADAPRAQAAWEVVSRATLAPGAWIVVGAPRAGPRPGAS